MSARTGTGARKTAITVASAAAIAMVLPAVKKSEGYWPTVKVDTIGTGQPCTGGYGETEGVKCGETHSEKFWSDRLAVRLREYDARIGECITVNAPDSVRAAMITTSYNAGTAAVCKSPMVARINTGNFRGACDALLTSKIVEGKRVYTGWYIRARGVVVPGLINRRRDDQKMCLAYLKGAPAAERAIKARGAQLDVEEAQKKARLLEIEADAPSVAPAPQPVAPPSAPAKPSWYKWIFK